MIKAIDRRLVIGVILGILVSLALYIFVSHTPYSLAIGCIAGVYYARPAGLLPGAATGAVIALPLGLYISGIAWFASPTATAPRVGPLAALEDILLILVFGAVYGLVFVWLTKRMTRGRNISAEK